MTDTNTDAKRNAISRKIVSKWLFRVLQGALIGGGAILPGISGGVLCAVFGIYQPMMALLAHPIRTFKKYFFLLLPVLIGWGIGFYLFAKVLSRLFENSYMSSMGTWLFFGLIMGMMPQLFREAGKQGRTYKSWISLGVSMVLILSLLVFLQYGARISNIQPNLWWYLLCGVLWGLSLVIPGLSSSSILLFLGLYQTMTDGISHFSLEVLAPMAVGIALVILLTARSINYMFDKHYSSAYHAVLGFVIASTIGIILPASGNLGASGEVVGIVYTSDVTTILLWAGCFVIGFIIAWMMDRVGKRVLTRQSAEAAE